MVAVTKSRVRLVVVASAMGALAVLTYIGASASFLAQQAESTAVDTGDMSIVLGTQGTADNRLTIGATLGPGQSAQRQAKMTVGSEGATLSSVTLTTSGTNGPPTVFTDNDDGLKLWIARCSQAWTESGSNPDFSYSCGGTQQNVLGTSGSPVPIEQTSAALANLNLSDGVVNYLLIEVSLPGDAPPTMNGQSTEVSFTFTGTQRSGQYQ